METEKNEKKTIDSPLICEGNHFDWEYYEKLLKKLKVVEPDLLQERR